MSDSEAARIAETLTKAQATALTKLCAYVKPDMLMGRTSAEIGASGSALTLLRNNSHKLLIAEWDNWADRNAYRPTPLGLRVVAVLKEREANAVRS